MSSGKVQASLRAATSYTAISFTKRRRTTLVSETTTYSESQWASER